MQSIIYLSFMAIDINGGNYQLSNYLKFGFIVICFFYVLICAKNNNMKQFTYLRLALALTLISDLLILLLDQYLFGVMTFILVQQLYGIRMDILQRDLFKSKIIIIKQLQKNLVIGFITAVICVSFIYLKIKLDLLLLLTTFYFICFLVNGLYAFNLAKKFRHDRGIVLFAIGIFLFLLCDINVGIYNAAEYITLSEKLYSVLYTLSSVLMWAFYAPAQVLISLSGQYIGDNR